MSVVTTILISLAIVIALLAIIWLFWDRAGRGENESPDHRWTDPKGHG